jgi:hydroxymethylbilane synthase
MTSTQQSSRLRIATRRSPLAWRQAEMVGERLQACHPGLDIELVGMKTEGDRILDRSLAAIGGKGLFVKELERGLQDGRADIAVHSMKDVPAECADGLHLPVILERESPFDAFVSNRFTHPDELPAGAVIGSCSLRRASQLLHRYPACRIEELRGNVNSRLEKLDAGQFDAIVLAVAGLERLGFDARIAASMEAEICLPAIGQGALGIECRQHDPAVESLIAALHDADTAACVHAERAVSHGLGGSCLSPIAGYAWLEGDQLRLRARVGATDGSRLLATEAEGPPAAARAIGERAALALAADGARTLVENASG